LKLLGELLEQCERHTGKKLKLYTMQNDVGVEAARCSLAVQSMFAAAVNLCYERCLPQLTEALQSWPASPAREGVYNERRALPFGVVVLSFPPAAASTSVLNCVFDGTTHSAHLAVCGLPGRDKKELTVKGFAPLQSCGLTLREVAHGSLDDSGKLHLSAGDRFAPARTTGVWRDCAAAARRVEACCYARLHEIWNSHRNLLCQLSTNGPLVFIQRPRETYLVCRREVMPAGASLVADAEAARRLEETRISFGAAAAALLARVPEPIAPPQLGPRDWLGLIRGHVPGGKLTYPWLKEQLAAFGVHENRDKGDGSHWTLERATGEGVFSYTTSQRFRGQPNHFSHLPDVLEALRIPYSDFYRSLSANGSGRAGA